jgi:hypothetical protein
MALPIQVYLALTKKNKRFKTGRRVQRQHQWPGQLFKTPITMSLKSVWIKICIQYVSKFRLVHYTMVLISTEQLTMVPKYWFKDMRAWWEMRLVYVLALAASPSLYDWNHCAEPCNLDVSGSHTPTLIETLWM